ncbi:MAG: DUF4493 domain-containing protein [Rikenellaceae bacterium]
MRKFITRFVLLLFAAVLTVGCESEYRDFNDDNYYPSGGSGDQGDSEDPEEGDNYGYLQFASIFAEIEEASEESDTKATTATSLDDYIVKVWDTDDDILSYELSYSEVKAKIAENDDKGLPLQPGPYSVEAYSIDPDKIPDVGTIPHYQSEVEEFEIAMSETTTIEKLVCTMANVKASVSFTADILERFTSLTATLTYGTTVFTIVQGSDENYCYFKAIPASDGGVLEPIVLEISGLYKEDPSSDDAAVEISGWKQYITNVNAGDYKKINITIDDIDNGNLKFTITVENWVLGDILDVKSVVSSSEEIIEDSGNGETQLNAPKTTLLNGHDIADIFYVSPSIFDFDAETCSDVLKVQVTPNGTSSIVSIAGYISTDNDDLAAELDSKSLLNRKVSFWGENELSDHLVVKEDESGVIIATMKYTGMVELYKYMGNHTVTIVALDSQNRQSTTTLKINVTSDYISSGGPSVVWEGGYSFDDTHTISSSSYPNVVVNITSSTGITGFTVQINSAILTAEELESINLAQTMDLVNASGSMATALSSLGFPIGDEVTGSKSLTLDITEFMPMLAALGSGETTFVLTVTDSSGSSSKTLKFKVV